MHIHAHMYNFNSYFLGKPGLACCHCLIFVLHFLRRRNLANNWHRCFYR